MSEPSDVSAEELPGGEAGAPDQGAPAKLSAAKATPVKAAGTKPPAVKAAGARAAAAKTSTAKAPAKSAAARTARVAAAAGPAAAAIPGARRPAVELGDDEIGVEVGVGLEVEHSGLEVEHSGLDGLGIDRLEVSGPLSGPLTGQLAASGSARPAPYAGSDPLGRATVLIVGADYAPDTTGVAPHTTAMARNLAALAERVVVFTGVPRDLTGSLPALYRRTRRTYGQDGGVQVVRHGHHVSRRHGGLGRVRSESSFSRAALRTPLRHPPDLVIGVTPSVGGADAAGRLARRYGVPLMMVVQDLTSGSGRRRGPANALIAWREAVALRRAARVLIAGQHLRAPISDLGVEDERIHRLATWNITTPLSLDRAGARARLGWPGSGFVVVYSGNMGRAQDVPTVVQAARQLAGRAQEIRFVLVGDGSERQALQAAAADLRGVRFVDPVTAADYPAVLAAADVLILSERPGEPDRTLVAKLNSYLSAGRPVIAAVNPASPAAQAVRSVRAATTMVAPGEAKALAAAVARLCDEPGERERMAGAARRFAEAAAPGADPAERLREMATSLLRR